MLYFFLLSIFLTRLVFAVTFPMQLEQLAVNGNKSGFSILYMLYQALSAVLYLLIVFLLQLNQHLKLTHKYEYLLKVLKFSLSFIGLDLILSVAGWFKYNVDLLFPSALPISANLKTIPDVIVAGLLIEMLIFIVLFWLLQQKRKPLIRSLFLMSMFLTSLTALYVSYCNAGFYRSAEPLFAFFTYKEAAFGWMWFVLVLSAAGSQLIAGIMLRLKEQFINRYFAINYTLQLNRITLIAVLGLGINALLPQMILLFV